MIRYEIADNVFREREQRASDERISYEIIDLVCRVFGVTMHEMVNCPRKRRIVGPKQIAQSMIRKYTRLTLQTIADKFNQTHANIIFSCRTVENLRDTDVCYRFRLKAIDYEIQERILKTKSC